MRGMTSRWPGVRSERHIRELRRREAPFEPVQNGRDGVDAAMGIRKQGRLDAPAYVESYRLVEAGVHVHIFGWRRDLERPPVDVCVGFERDERRRTPFKSQVAGEFRYRHGVYISAYNMQCSVLINVIDDRNLIQKPAGVEQIVIPSVVWLQPLYRCLLPFSKALNGFPPAGVPLGSEPGGIDRELGVPLDIGRHTPTEPANVKLVSEIVQGGSEIEENISDQQYDCWVNRFDIADAEAVLAAFVVSLSDEAVELAISPTEDVMFEGHCMFYCTTQFADRFIERASHDGKVPDSPGGVL